MTNPQSLFSIPAPSRKRSAKKSVRVIRKASDMSLVEQVRTAFDLRRNKLAMVIGAPFSAIPFASWWLTHNELVTLLNSPMNAWNVFRIAMVVAVILGCLVFSAKSVFQFAKVALRDKAKSIALVVLLELILLFSGTEGLSIGALAVLIGINLVANTCNIALDSNKKN